MRVTRAPRAPMVLLGSLSVTAGLVLAAPAATAATVDVTDLTPALTPVSVSRLAVDEVTVTFQVDSDAGQSRDPKVVDDTSGVAFPGARATLVAGDLDSGTWEATVALASVMDGTHHPGVRVCIAASSCDVWPLTTEIVVHGSDQPVLKAITQDPRRLRAGEVAGADTQGRVVFSASLDPAPGVPVRLVRHAGDAGRVVDRTSASGRFTTPWPWTYPGQDPARVTLTHPDLPGVRLDSTVIGNPSTRFRVPRPNARAVVAPDRRFTVSGTITPGYPASRLGSIRLQVRTESGWSTRASTQLRPVRNASGDLVNRARYRLATRFSTSGHQVLRLVKPAAMCADGHCRVARSRSERFSVVVGNPTFVAEHRLDALGVPVGAVDGKVDARSRQAFCAWRDMTGRKPTRHGLTKGLVRSILHHTELPAPARVDGLYVNKTCQVLLQVKRHEFRRIVWVSTGASGYETPSGVGHIYRKIDGWVESTLYPGAYMLNPMFFLPARPGIALHGSASNDLVHPYPASHGCVRTWRPQILRIFDESPLGTRVKVYGGY